MSRRHVRDRDDATVSAKDLAEMGFCEKRVLLEHLHGRRLTPEEQRSVERGRRVHEQYYREGIAARSAPASDRRCFIANCLFGASASQTVSLRHYRDAVLLPCRVGRVVVGAYYVFSPIACALLRRLPFLQRPMRAVVSVIAVKSQRRLKERRNS